MITMEAAIELVKEFAETMKKDGHVVTEDLLHDMYIVALEHSPIECTALLHKIREMFEEDRRKRGHKTKINMIKEITQKASMLDVEDLVALKICVDGFLNNLTKKDQEIFDLLNIKGFSIGEVADIIGVDIVYVVDADQHIRSSFLKELKEAGLM